MITALRLMFRTLQSPVPVLRALNHRSNLGA